jgi:O-antigen/teichoic acid export membrane protein
MVYLLVFLYPLRERISLTSKSTVVEGATFIYIEIVISIVAGYLFWIIMSKITTTEIIGIGSVVISFATIFATIGGLGANIGVQRFLGRSFSQNNMDDAKLFVKGAVILTAIGLSGSVIFTLTAQSWVRSTFDISFQLIIVGIIFLVSSTIMTLLRYIIISSLKTRALPLTMIIGNISRITCGTVLVLWGAGAMGILVGFTVFPAIAVVSFSLVILKFLSKGSGQKSRFSLREGVKMIFEASSPSWIPFSIYTVGIHLGPIVVFGSQGASQAGVYAMAFFIVTAISASSSALFSIAYPKLSGMDDGRKRFAWRTIQMSLIIAVPFSIFLIFYGANILQLLGTSYIQGSLSLGILLATMLPVIVTAGVNILVYSYGNYSQVLTIGLISNVPRVALYFLLVPIYGDEGAAISYSIGSITGFIASVIISRKIGLNIIWWHLAAIVSLPAGVCALTYYLGIEYVAAFFISLIITYLGLLKIKILMKDDVNDIIRILPPQVSRPIIALWSRTREIFDKSKKQ